jgi:hypothetical protein
MLFSMNKVMIFVCVCGGLSQGLVLEWHPSHYEIIKYIKRIRSHGWCCIQDFQCRVQYWALGLMLLKYHHGPWHFVSNKLCILFSFWNIWQLDRKKEVHNFIKYTTIVINPKFYLWEIVWWFFVYNLALEMYTNFNELPKTMTIPSTI